MMQRRELFSIGEFSQATGLTVKTLRFYHEQNLLMPTCVDDQTGYRYYDPDKVEQARIITKLRELEFSLAEIQEILNECQDETDLLDYLERHKKTVAAKREHYRQVEARLDELIQQQRDGRNAMSN